MKDNAKNRVEKELLELREREEKLEKFLKSKDTIKSEYFQLNLLREQLDVMHHYVKILETRLKLWRD